MKIVRLLLVFIFFRALGMTAVLGQLNVFYYENNHTLFEQSKAVDIVETLSGEIKLLYRYSDANFKTHAIQIIDITPTGQKTGERIIELNNLYDLHKLVDLGNNRFSIYANLTINKIYQPTNLILNTATGEQQQINESVVYSTSLVDLELLDANKALVLLTKSGKNELYNITLNKVDLSTNKVDWFKKISSEQNEEADEVNTDKEGNIFVLGKKYNDNITEYVPILYKLSQDGSLIWKKALDIPVNFNTQSIEINESGEVYYACGYVKTQTGMSETKVMKYSGTGDLIQQINLPDFSSNGILWTSNQKLLLYGSRFLVNARQVVTKGAIIILDASMNETYNKALSTDDKPDADFQFKTTSSSDLQTAIELKNGKILLCGKVYMPKEKDEQTKQNNPLVIFLDKN